MKMHSKSSKKIDKIFIPAFGEIPIGVGTVPSSGATVSIEQLNKEFERATKERIIPPPPDNSNTL